MLRKLWALEMKSRSRNGETVSGLTSYFRWLRDAYNRVSVLRHIEEEGEDRLWQAKDRRREKKRLQKEQEAEADGTEKSTEQGAAGDTDPRISKSISNVARKPSDFY